MGSTIVLNGRVLRRPRLTGVERLAHEVIGRLLALRPDVYRLVAPPTRRGGAPLQAWEQTVLPARAARMGADLVYSPANLVPFAWPRNVVVLHDASVWRNPQELSRIYRTWHRTAEGLAARRALAVITVSAFSRREIVELLGLDPARIAVVPAGVGAQFHTGVDPEPVRRAFALGRPYVLALASRRARKNLELLAPLARGLAPEGVEVVLAGVGRPPEGEAAGVRMLGYVPDDQLPGLYAGARAFVFPSHYEGFGLPCVEAMACGTPVVAADRPALPETCGDAAVLADPDDAGAFVQAVLGVLGDETLCGRLREAGWRRAAAFSWDRAAEATDAVLMRVVAER